MLLSHSHRFIFLKTQKTASTSVEIALSRLAGGPSDIITPISNEDEKLRQRLGLPGPRNYLAGPHRYGAGDLWKLASRLKLKKKFYNHIPARLAQQRLPSETWSNYLIISIERHPFDKAISSYYWRTRKQRLRISLSEYLQTCPTSELSNWDIYTINDQLVVDFMLRYEQLEADLEQLSARLGLRDTLQLPRERTKSQHRQDHRPWQDVLDPTSIQRLRLVCAKELLTFHYSSGQP